MESYWRLETDLATLLKECSSSYSSSSSKESNKFSPLFIPYDYNSPSTETIQRHIEEGDPEAAVL